MNRAQRKKILRLFVSILTLLLVSCGGSVQGGFQKQKYTHLKQIKNKGVEDLLADTDKLEPENTNFGSSNPDIVYAENEEFYVSDQMHGTAQITIEDGNNVLDGIETVETELDQNSNLPEVFFEPKKRPTKIDYNSERSEAKKYFFYSLLCLAIIVVCFALAFPVNITILVWVLVLLTGIGFVIGYIILCKSVIHSRRIRTYDNKAFQNDRGLRGLYILGILGMLLFGCFPFCIPFGIAWWIVKKKANSLPA